jgi:UDP-N-acetylmuramoyl-L-alanyl-D-glutamate--2,6-diaminopimelate ligase
LWRLKAPLVDGHDYIDQAIKDGAIAVICEELPAHTATEVDFLMVNNSAKALGTLAANFYENPSSNLKLGRRYRH